MAKIFKAVVLFFVFAFLPIVAQAATLSISPASGDFEVGDRATVKIMATSNGTPFNAVSGTVSFPTSIFSLDSVSKANSVLNFWITEPTANAGVVKFEGIALGGFGGSSGTVLTINLRAIKTGTGTASFKSGQILANDGQGTDITGNLTGGTFFVKEATVKPTPIKIQPSAPTPVEVVQPEPSLRAPEIMLGSKYGAQAVLGTSDYGKAQVLVTFVALDGSKVFILGTADEDGSFILLVPNSLKRGGYSVTAVMIKSDKTNSQTSNQIVVSVGNPFSDIGWEIWSLIVLLILVILYLILRTHMHFYGKSKMNDTTKNDLNKVSTLIHKSFDLLREDVVDSEKEKLTSEGHKRMLLLKKDISDAEKIISKEIKDIES